MNIQNANNITQAVRNNPVLENIERGQGQERGFERNVEDNENVRDNFTRSDDAERMSALDSRRNELIEEQGNLDQNQNQTELEQNRGAEIRREITGIEREMENIAQPENDAADRRQREAINSYTEQNQAVSRARTTTRRVMNLFGE